MRSSLGGQGRTAALNVAVMTFALAESLNCGLGITTETRMQSIDAE
jgi:hypothetical protein